MDDQRHLDEAFEAIEETILPSVSLMLDTLLDAATLAQPGVDAEIHAAELRMLSVQLKALTLQVEAISTSCATPEDYPAASAA